MVIAASEESWILSNSYLKRSYYARTTKADTIPETSRQTRALRQMRVESVNALSPGEFFTQYIPQCSIEILQSLDSEVAKLTVVFEGGKALTSSGAELLDMCLTLIESTSATDYANSEIRWSVSKKRREMRLPDIRYVILVDKHGNANANLKECDISAFLSFMITYEDGQEVAYCYEVHVAECWRGRGLGRNLMRVFEGVGRGVGVRKCMLTAFRSNDQALRFYEKLGYVEDDFSPGTRVLRNGTVKQPSYVIMSKRIRSLDTVGLDASPGAQANETPFTHGRPSTKRVGFKADCTSYPSKSS